MLTHQDGMLKELVQHRRTSLEKSYVDRSIPEIRQCQSPICIEPYRG